MEGSIEATILALCTASRVPYSQYSDSPGAKTEQKYPPSQFVCSSSKQDWGGRITRTVSKKGSEEAGKERT